MTLQISELSVDDVAAAVSLWKQAGLTRPWNDPVDDAALALEGPSSTILAGKVGENLVATIMVGWDGHRASVYYLAVEEACRGKGLGRAMMEAAEQWLARFNAPKLNLMIREDNTAVLGFYDALGYGRDAVIVRSRRLRP